MRNKKVTVFSLVVLLSLMMSLVFPTGALADDNTPPPTEAPEVVTPPEETPAQEPAADTVAPVTLATEEPALTEEVVATEAAVSDVATPEPTADTGSTESDVVLLSQLPENTEVVVSNAEGEIVILGSQEAADIIAVQDPVWCPAGQAPTPGQNGCTNNFPSSQALIDAMDASNPANSNSIYEQNGIVYFTVNPGAGSFTLASGNNSNTFIDTNDYNVLRTFNLILQGGWDGVSGSTTFTQTNFGTNPLTIGTNGSPWGGNITLNGFTFSGVSSTDAVTIYTAGNITLNNVTANLTTGNGNRGAELDNTSGSGSVTVTGSTFNQTNNSDGLRIRSDGLITLVNTVANQNGGNGADISNDFNGNSQSIVVVKSTFNNNNDNGLSAASRGNITLINVTAQTNGADGVALSFPTQGTHTVTICGGSFTGQSGNNGNDYNVQVNNGDTLTRSTSHSPYANWGTVNSGSWSNIVNGTGLCTYPDNDVDMIPDQWDTTPNGDTDNDGVDNLADNCPSVSNANQANVDGDAQGDACDPFPNDPNNDVDGDGIGGNVDNCPSLSNANQANADGDAQGDACDPFPNDPNNDTDGDGIGSDVDNCPSVANPTQTDMDGDGTGDACDTTPNGDTDSDGVDNNVDNCPSVANPAQTDMDGDGTGDACDTTPNGDTDSDGVDNNVDNCPSIANSTQTDTDEDGTGDACDTTPNGDTDEDGIDNQADNCPSIANSDQTDTDEDGTGNACDSTPNGQTNSQPEDVGGTTVNNDVPLDQTDGAPLFIPVTGIQGSALSCAEPSTTLNMAGFEVTFTNLCDYSAVLTEAAEGSLLGALPDGNGFVGGIDIVLVQDGNVVSPFPTDATTMLSFEIPSGMSGDSLTILYWDSGAGSWVEKSVTVANGKVTLAIDEPGTYVLVDKSTTTSMKDTSPVVTTLNGLYLAVIDFFKQFTLQ